ncbi:putative disease resistance protein RGA3 [Oryza glaberrima]|uniref:putative disease resistance protein RGA3 n=1 Tax=Oryza glaberrima TaxID=4538 RepID=UPI00023DEC8C|nr:putative disease resistance protein RGA3 [Oryza glaberrima]
MEVIVSAIMGEFANRTISFLIQKYSKRVTTTTEEERLDNLQRLLLRVRIIIEDAEERHVTNQAMLHQLNILRKEMYRGYYTLDTFRFRAHDVKKEKDHEVSYSFVLSKFNHAKRVCFCSDSDERVKELEKVVVSLETIIGDANEFIKLSSTYPRLSRQPYSMYLLLDKCMFGRQMEMECVINFLLQEEITYGADHLGVLPIIGPGKVGKSTLVEHACIDERVRSHFSQIVFFSKDGLTDGNIVTLKDCGTTKHQTHDALGGSERRLVVVELDGEIDQGLWERFYSASKSCFAYGSKIIITSRSDKIASFGTTQPLKLQFLTHEAFWYLFRVRAFGSSDPAENPKLASLAMDMASEVSGCFTSVNMFNGPLRSNTTTRFWSFVLATIRGFKQKNLSIYSSTNPLDPWAVVAPLYIPRANKNLDPVAILNNYQRNCNETHSYSGLITASSPSAASQIMVQDIMFGTATPPGKFEVLAWRSHIPPYYSCVFDCEIKRPPTCMVSRKKKTKKIGI